MQTSCHVREDAEPARDALGEATPAKRVLRSTPDLMDALAGRDEPRDEPSAEPGMPGLAASLRRIGRRTNIP